MATIFTDLVMDDGNLVRIECPGKFEDEFHDSINTAIKIRAEWAPNRFDGCSATYLGHRLDRVNMARVIGRMG
jgi:hypothetical protein